MFQEFGGDIDEASVFAEGKAVVGGDGGGIAVDSAAGVVFVALVEFSGVEGVVVVAAPAGVDGEAVDVFFQDDISSMMTVTGIV